MVLYYSGTGNSAYVAKRIGREINDEVINLFERIRNHDFSQLTSARPWILVVPTYAWRIPRIVREWIEHTTLGGSRAIYFVMTCGDGIGNAGEYLEKLCAEKGMHYLGCAEIVMPENYIALFKTPTEAEAARIIEQAECTIDGTIRCIKNRDMLPQPAISLMDRIYSGVVNTLFYPLFVHAKKFYVTGGCISCGNCAAVCPMNNIRIAEGRPVWDKTCTHCMACICRCPKEAIEYGRHSHGLPRYTCKKEV